MAVMAGLVSAIHVSASRDAADVHARDGCGHDASKKVTLRLLLRAEPPKTSRLKKQQRPDLGPAAVTKHRSRRLANYDADGTASIRGSRAHHVVFFISAFASAC